jgi:hypothetical protein
VSDASNELILGIWSLTLSAKGTPAVWLVVPVSAILIAFAWRIASRRPKR